MIKTDLEGYKCLEKEIEVLQAGSTNKEHLDKLILKRNSIEGFITNVEDSQIRLMLVLKYIKGYSWLKVAFAVGKWDEQYPRKKVCKFLKEFDEKGD